MIRTLPVVIGLLAAGPTAWAEDAADLASTPRPVPPLSSAPDVHVARPGSGPLGQTMDALGQDVDVRVDSAVDGDDLYGAVTVAAAREVLAVPTTVRLETDHRSTGETDAAPEEAFRLSMDAVPAFGPIDLDIGPVVDARRRDGLWTEATVAQTAGLAAGLPGGLRARVAGAVGHAVDAPDGGGRRAELRTVLAMRPVHDLDMTATATLGGLDAPGERDRRRSAELAATWRDGNVLHLHGRARMDAAGSTDDGGGGGVAGGLAAGVAWRPRLPGAPVTVRMDARANRSDPTDAASALAAGVDVGVSLRF